MWVSYRKEGTVVWKEGNQRRKGSGGKCERKLKKSQRIRFFLPECLIFIIILVYKSKLLESSLLEFPILPSNCDQGPLLAGGGGMMVWEAFLDTLRCLLDWQSTVHSASLSVDADRVLALMTSGLHPLMGTSCGKRSVSQESHPLSNWIPTMTASSPCSPAFSTGVRCEFIRGAFGMWWSN